MRDLIASGSLPWYIWVMLGFFLCAIVFLPKFKSECDKFLANMMGMKPKRKRQ